MTNSRLGIIADDLTGALDATAPFAKRGVPSLIVTSAKELFALLSAEHNLHHQVIAVNTGSRHLCKEQAKAKVNHAIQALRAAGVRHWYKKVDSTLRGQPVAESLSMAQQLDLRLVFCPAAPGQQRTVIDGDIYVDGVALAVSVYADDAISPAARKTLAEQFAAEDVYVAKCNLSTIDQLPTDHCILDASVQADLNRIGRLVISSSHTRQSLSVGAAGLAEGLAQALYPKLKPAMPAFRRIQKRVYIVGSRNDRAKAQIRALLDDKPELKMAHALHDSVDVIRCADIVTPGQIDQSKLEPTVVANQLGQAALAHLSDERGSDQLLFLCGGDVALASLEALSIQCLEPQGEWLPGVSLSRVYPGDGPYVMTKPGGFGAVDVLKRIEELIG